MAPTFFKNLRRRSRASIRTDQQSTTDDSSEGGTNSQGTGRLSGLTTPASISQKSDPALNVQPKDKECAQQQQQQEGHVQQRPPPAPTSNTNRHSVSGMSGLGAPSVYGRQNLPLSQYAPMVHNAQSGTFVFQKVLLLDGTIGEPSQHSIDGSLTVTKFYDDFPPIVWPVCSSHFKALVYLQPGPNKIRLDFSSPKIANCSTSNPIHASYITIHMIPPLGNPPLHLAILLGKDSPGVYDASPARAEREGHGLATAVRKFRMAAYLWQAFTAEQMRRHNLGRRTFRFDEEWTSGTSNNRDQEHGRMRSEARIHIIRSEKTVAEIRDLSKPQHHDASSEKNALFGIAADAVKKYFSPVPGQKQYVTVLILDTHWDKAHETITGHAAIGSKSGDLHLSIFGSHCLQSYPASLEEVVSAFSDCTPTDTNYVANDCNEAGSSWEAANIGLGGHLHAIGRAFGCTNQESGVMYRDYVVFNRTFLAREAYSTRTKSKGGLCMRSDECGWHRLDALRFRAHPAFRLPADPPLHTDGSVQAYPIEASNASIVASSGISFIEIFADGDEVCHTWLEYHSDASTTGQRQMNLADLELRNKIPPHKRKGKIRLSIMSHGGGSLEIHDFKKFVSRDSFVKLDDRRYAFRSRNVGESQVEGSEPHEIVFASAVEKHTAMSRVIVYHSSAVDGLEFIYDEGPSQLFGKKAGQTRGDIFEFDVRKGESIAGFYVRAGLSIHGIQILTNLGRKSELFGDPHGGEPHHMIPPRGHNICGVSGSYGSCLNSFSILVTR